MRSVASRSNECRGQPDCRTYFLNMMAVTEEKTRAAKRRRRRRLALVLSLLTTTRRHVPLRSHRSPRRTHHLRCLSPARHTLTTRSRSDRTPPPLPLRRPTTLPSSSELESLAQPCSTTRPSDQPSLPPTPRPLNSLLSSLSLPPRSCPLHWSVMSSVTSSAFPPSSPLSHEANQGRGQAERDQRVQPQHEYLHVRASRRNDVWTLRRLCPRRQVRNRRTRTRQEWQARSEALHPRHFSFQGR
jgi:hypothetical protein